MGDLVWICATAESNYAGIRDVVEYSCVPRAEWDAMTETEKQAFIADCGHAALEQLATYGADVVDESEVPADVVTDLGGA